MACIFKIKNQDARLKQVVLENERMEEMIRYVKRAFSSSIFIEFKDSLLFKNDLGLEKAFNLVQMIIFKPNDLDVRFKDAVIHGFLDKMTQSWRQKFTTIVGSKPQASTWVRYYYVLKKFTLYVYEKDNYDRPMETLNLEAFSLSSKGSGHGGKEWVFELSRLEGNAG